MQSKSLVFIFLFIIALPLIVISTSHKLFFAVASLAILIGSVKYILRGSSDDISNDALSDEELEEELEELININIEKFSTGISIVYNMIVILFLIYCAFFFDTLVLKALAAAAVLFQVYFIIKKSEKSKSTPARSKYSIQGLLSSFLNIAVIVFTVINKLYRQG